jgi:hypothetical protein
MTQINNSQTNSNQEINNQQKEILDFAVIGAGIAGLTFANTMNSLGFSIAVFEKSRGTGGRMSSKRVNNSQHHPMAFDLGCASFFGESKSFKEQLDYWHQLGILAPWLKDEQDRDHYVATSRNSSLTRFLSKDLTCHFSTKIGSIRPYDGYWQIDCDKGSGINCVYARNIILATPAPQALDLLPKGIGIELKNQLASVKLAPQWVLAIEIDDEYVDLADLSFPNSEVIHSISIESTKPTREHQGSTKILQIQATAQWSENNIDADKAFVERSILIALEQITGEIVIALNSHLHRWLYSTVSRGLKGQSGYLWDTSLSKNHGLGLIGDYFDTQHFGIEASWHSAIALADYLSNVKGNQPFTRADQND